MTDHAKSGTSEILHTRGLAPMVAKAQDDIDRLFGMMEVLAVALHSVLTKEEPERTAMLAAAGDELGQRLAEYRGTHA